MRNIGIEFVIISIRIVKIDAVSYLVVRGRVDGNLRLDRAAPGSHEISLIIDFPPEVVETRLQHAKGSTLHMPTDSNQRLRCRLHQSHVMMRVAIGQEVGADAVFFKDFFDAGDLGIKLRRSLEVADDHVGVTKTAGHEARTWGHEALLQIFRSRLRSTQNKTPYDHLAPA